MKTLKISLITLLLLLPFSMSSNAVQLCSGGANDCHGGWNPFSHDDKKKFKGNGKYMAAAMPALIMNFFISEFDIDAPFMVPGLVGDHLYASGDIYIEKEYFFDNLASGMTFEQKGKLYFEPALPKDFEMPDFSPWQFVDGVGFSEDYWPIDYLVTVDFADVIRHFHALGNIYVIDSGYGTEVPLPTAALGFASGLLMLVMRRKASRSKAA